MTRWLVSPDDSTSRINRRSVFPFPRVQVLPLKGDNMSGKKLKFVFLSKP